MASFLFEPLGPYALMLVTAGLLAICLVFPNLVNRMEGRSRGAASGAADKPLGGQGAFKLVLTKRYLFLIAFLMVVLNVVNTTGEFILGKTVTEEARRVAAAARSAPVERAAFEAETAKRVRDFIAGFYGDFFFTVNLTGALAQLFVVSRVMKFCGVPAALFFLPVIALAGYTMIAIAPVLALVRVAKILENSTDYSLQNTARQALFLPTTREEKYKAKAAIDTFFVRIGDLLSTALVFMSAQLALSVRALSAVNIVLIALWLALAVGIGRNYRALAAQQQKAA
ncbi:MAG TPA: Npt1/Npt2 family nucleotide transporter [Candidatus Acidoferrales bacterium]|nr:Npt1/Npt2 family nucleotide transporter [Candidatus Acidoferrales bacterium]